MDIQLPKELYIYIYIIGNDTQITKKLRLLCKSSYFASYDYFNIVLKTPTILNCDYGQWYFYQKDDCWEIYYNFPVRKKFTFNIDVENLYECFERTERKEVEFDYT